MCDLNKACDKNQKLICNDSICECDDEISFYDGIVCGKNKYLIQKIFLEKNLIFFTLVEKMQYNDTCDNDNQCLGPNMKCIKSIDSQNNCLCTSHTFWNATKCGKFWVNFATY